MKSIAFTWLALTGLTTSCLTDQTVQYRSELMRVDSSFSAYSMLNGKNAAFLRYADSSVTMLVPNSYPMIGIEMLKHRQKARPDTGYILTWIPKFAHAARSGDLGYTYGIWELRFKANPDSVRQGTYSTVWKKNKTGEWKFVLDSGNEGLGDLREVNEK